MAGSSKALIDLTPAMNLEPVPLLDWLIIAPVAWCILVGTVLLMMRKNTAQQHYVAIPAMGVQVIITAALLSQIVINGPTTMVMGRWLPPFGIAFTVDMLGAILAFVAAIVALACTIYGVKDVNSSGRRYGFYSFFFLLMAGVSGAFLTGDIFNLYVWFEVLLIASFGLLILGSEKGQLDGATKYAFLNLVATTLFLIATAYLYGIFGTLNMADIALKIAQSDGTLPLNTVAGLFVLAFIMKAAAFPVNFWLPASYHTPRVVISALFAGLLTKVGVYAILRIYTMLFSLQREALEPTVNIDALSFVVAIVACLTMILGAIGALAQTNVRRLLGFLVVSGIGVMLMGVAIGTEAALGGTVFYALHSILVMTALYIAAGMAAKLCGVAEDMTKIRGIYQKNTLLAAITLMLFFAVAGLPPFSGFWPKLMLVKASIEGAPWWAPFSILLTGFLSTIAVGRVWALSYWKPVDVDAENSPQNANAKSALGASEFVPLIGLTIIVVGVGLFPQTVFELAYEASEQLVNPTAYIESVFGSEVVE